MPVQVTLFLEEVLDISPSQFQAKVVRVARFTDMSAAAAANGTRASLPLDVARKIFWDPVLSFVNLSPDSEAKVVGERFEVWPDGKVVVSERLIATFGQNLDLGLFPFDKQDLEIRVAPRTCSADEVVLIEGGRSGASDFSDGVFRMWAPVGVAMDVRTSVYSNGLLTSQVVLTLTIRRSADTVLKTLVLPSQILVIAALAVLWMPLERYNARMVAAWLPLLAWLGLQWRLTGYGLPLSMHDRLSDVFAGSMMFVQLLILIQIVLVQHLYAKPSLALAIKLEAVSRFMFPAFFITIWMAFLFLLTDIEGLRRKTPNEVGGALKALQASVLTLIVLVFLAPAGWAIYRSVTFHSKIVQDFMAPSPHMAMDLREIAVLYRHIDSNCRGHIELKEIDEALQDQHMKEPLRGEVREAFALQVSEPNYITQDEFCLIWLKLARGRLDHVLKRVPAVAPPTQPPAEPTAKPATPPSSPSELGCWADVGQVGPRALVYGSGVGQAVAPRVSPRGPPLKVLRGSPLPSPRGSPHGGSLVLRGGQLPSPRSPSPHGGTLGLDPVRSALRPTLLHNASD